MIGTMIIAWILTWFNLDNILVDAINQIFNIMENVRTALLEWSIVLEENGIVGEGMQFSKEEKEIAAATPIINNYTTNFFGDVSNSQVQQGTDNSTQAQ